VTSLRRTTLAACKRLTNDENRERLIRPRGHSRARGLAGAMNDRVSSAMKADGGGGRWIRGFVIR